MAGRRKVYGSSSVPRYKAKMYDYMSRGGRIPMVLTMEVVDAMGEAWGGGFFAYKDDRDDAIAKAFEENTDVPHIYGGLAKALLMRVMKLAKRKGMTYDEALESVVEENNLPDGDPVRRLLEEAVEKLKNAERERGSSGTKT